LGLYFKKKIPGLTTLNYHIWATSKLNGGCASFYGKSVSGIPRNLV